MTTASTDDEAGKLYYMKEFKKQLTRFLDELIEQFPNEGDFVLLRIFIHDQIPIADVLGRFIRDVLPLKDMIGKRDDSFFLENYLFPATGNLGDRIDHFRRLWVSDALSEEDRVIMWKWVDVFLQLGEIYFKKYGYVHGWMPASASTTA